MDRSYALRGHYLMLRGFTTWKPTLLIHIFFFINDWSSLYKAIFFVMFSQKSNFYSVNCRSPLNDPFVILFSFYFLFQLTLFPEDLFFTCLPMPKIPKAPWIDSCEALSNFPNQHLQWRLIHPTNIVNIYLENSIYTRQSKSIFLYMCFNIYLVLLSRILMFKFKYNFYIYNFKSNEYTQGTFSLIIFKI